ncbi:nucleotidyltransferase family protein [Phaeobacter gallaeciensis]|uniref:MobA-related protein n=1 Tax=Phaeobacter gallaeciensis TaxID=60890 RepID=A0AAC9Z8Q1_9RHOB|nr:nucleotidyltransferase family protein [Phaeobacter gallaeciensis]AHD09752.1 putative MobA-related protein [Phaeobacter gallaeciensis DSM 26640]ATE93016.1 putative MobA-related protein [Phaeobacter gallaeciensis]ATE97162.1 putative MobA-related protein [Phaeobacter gallaeciensis]ATF01681.1 putative MobA-related protein [Phaeobacter gallaeciensis]ATF06061.1 putative MobA-related protein [Phaeobacter gallaeciensis]
MTAIAILILAAGAARRMRGRDKLLEQINGRPLLAQICAAAISTGQEVHVTLPSPDHPRAEVLRDHCKDATPVYVPDAAEGMAASIRAGVGALSRDYDAVMIMPADMPELTAKDLMQVLARIRTSPDQILRATGADGTFGHPVVFPRRYFTALSQLTGDQGARAILKAAQHQGEVICPVPLPASHALTDLDTPEAWAAWRQAQKSTPAG